MLESAFRVAVPRRGRYRADDPWRSTASRSPTSAIMARQSLARPRDSTCWSETMARARRTSSRHFRCSRRGAACAAPRRPQRGVRRRRPRPQLCRSGRSLQIDGPHGGGGSAALRQGAWTESMWRLWRALSTAAEGLAGRGWTRGLLGRSMRPSSGGSPPRCLARPKETGKSCTRHLGQCGGLL